MTRQNISLTEEQVRRLEEERLKTGLGKSEVVRRAIDKYFDERDGNATKTRI